MSMNASKSHCIIKPHTQQLSPRLITDGTHLPSFLLLFLLLHCSHFQRDSCFHTHGQPFPNLLPMLSTKNKNERILFHYFTFSYLLHDRSINEQRHYWKVYSGKIIHQRIKRYEINNIIYNYDFWKKAIRASSYSLQNILEWRICQN